MADDWAPDEYDHAADDRWMTESEIIAVQVDAALYAVTVALDAFADLPDRATAEERRDAIMARREEVAELVAARAAERRGEQEDQDQAPVPAARPDWRTRLWG